MLTLLLLYCFFEVNIKTRANYFIAQGKNTIYKTITRCYIIICTYLATTFINDAMRKLPIE